MKRALALTMLMAVAALMLVPLAWAADIQGTIKSVDPSGHVLTLADGTQLMIPANLSVQRQDLQPGASVKASYQDQGTQKVITAIQVQPAKK